MTRSPVGEPKHGATYPPRHAFDVLAYPAAETLAGTLGFRLGDAEPGDNRSPAFRWGWRCRARDCQLHDDGFDALREAAGFMRGAMPTHVVELSSYRAIVHASHEATP